MTTTVTVKTHDWPVKVSSFALTNREPNDDANWEKVAEVPANSSQEFIIHNGQDLLFTELPSEAEKA